VSHNLKSFLKSPIKYSLKNLDFIKILERLSQLEPGKSYVENSSKPGPSFEDQEQIAKLAVDLAERSFSAKGDPVNRQELKSHADIISCQYDWPLHKTSKAACFNVLTHIFETQSLENLYISEDRRELKNLPKVLEAQKDNLGVVYLINHTSHFDEFLFDIFLDSLGLQLPLFAAGSNMMATPSLTKFFMIGSYVIIRKGASRSYLSVLHHYCQALAEMGKPQGIFLEAWSGGARTRDGSLRYPRRLVTLQGALACRGDVLIQPVVISYSRVPEDLDLSEGKGLWSWLNGHHMYREALKSPAHPLQGMARGLKGLYGRTYIEFCEGKLLSQLKSEWTQKPQTLELDEYTALYAIREIARDKKIMASHLAALGLELALKRGSNDIVAQAEEKLADIRDYHSRVFETEPSLEDFVRDRPMVETISDGLASLGARKIIKGRLEDKKLPKVRSWHGLSYYATHSDHRLYSPAGKENMVVCGAGPWGFALVTHVGRRTLNDRKFHNSSLSLYDSSPELIAEIDDQRTHREFPSQRLPKNVFPSSDTVEAFRKANDVIVAVPPLDCQALFKTIFSNSKDLRSLILASRGFDPLSHRLTIQIAWEAAVAAGRPDVSILALSGPFSPEDLLEDKGGSFILASSQKEGKIPEASLFKFNKFQVVESSDPLGVQVAAALADAYSLYYAYLSEHKSLKQPAQIAAFIREVSYETKTLAMALGAKPSTFESDQYAWIPEFIFASLTAETHYSVKQAALKGGDGLRHLLQDNPEEYQWPDKGALGYQSIRSAHLIAKNLSLKVPHLDKANDVFWGNTIPRGN
jgi:glycerol-3-phosphate dehydrogenase